MSCSHPHGGGARSIGPGPAQRQASIRRLNRPPGLVNRGVCFRIIPSTPGWAVSFVCRAQLTSYRAQGDGSAHNVKPSPGLNQIPITTDDIFVLVVDLLPIFISAYLLCDPCQIVPWFHLVPYASRCRTVDMKDLPRVNQVGVVTNNPSVLIVDNWPNTSVAALTLCDSPECVTRLDRVLTHFFLLLMSRDRRTTRRW